MQHLGSTDAEYKDGSCTLTVNRTNIGNDAEVDGDLQGLKIMWKGQYIFVTIFTQIMAPFVGTPGSIIGKNKFWSESIHPFELIIDYSYREGSELYDQHNKKGGIVIMFTFIIMTAFGKDDLKQSLLACLKLKLKVMIRMEAKYTVG